MDEITAASDLRHGDHGAPAGSNANPELNVPAPAHHDPQPDIDSDDGLPSARPLASNDTSLDFDDESTDPTSNFAFSPNQLHKLITAKTVAALRVFGGLRGLAAGLRTDLSAGLSVDETTLDGTVTFQEAVAAGRDARPAVITELQPPPTPPTLIPNALRLGEPRDQRYTDRKRIFGANHLPQRKQKSFLRLMWIAFNDKLMILLTISAVISLTIGIYQSVDPNIDSSGTEWVDGVTVVAAITVIVFASATTDWQKNYKFKKLNERKDERDVTVVRSGRLQTISVYDVMVGDILHIQAGDVVAVDGVLVHGAWLQVDESSSSGESELVHKTVPSENDDTSVSNADPFILSGTTVARGVGQYLVTSVGFNSSYGRMLMSLRTDVQETPLQAKLGRLGKQLIIIGIVAGSIFFLILFVRYLIHLHRYQNTQPTQKGEYFLHVLILAITVVIITIPEGLGLNVTFALAFATKRMLKDNNLVRLIRSCEIMGNATTICSDKTGTLTQNQMSVVAGRIGLQCYFDDTDLAVTDLEASMSRASTIKCETSTQLMTTLSADAKNLIKDIIALDSTAFESDDSGTSDFVGSSTETALLEFGRLHLGMRRLAEERANCPVLTMLPFDPSRKWMAVLIKLPNGMYRLLVKGAAEVVFEYCAFIVSDPTFRLPIARLSEDDRTSFHNTIQDYASKLLRPVALAYRDFTEAEIFEDLHDDPDSVNLEWLASGMAFLSVFGIRDPLRPEVVESVRQCQEAGVFVRMVTGDNFLTAKAIASECGIYTAGGIAMDGSTFRDLSSEQLDAVIPRLQVLARSSPEDKLLLVSRLKAMNETVAVTGDGTNDGLALKAADVGFAMGKQGTEVAKEAASIILLDDNFASIVKAVAWGRTVNDSVKRFCQFQFTINVTAGIITVVSELAGDAIFTVVQLLWINLIMDIFASLCYSTDLPSPDFLHRKPEPRNAPIVSVTMWKMILGQSIYQLAVVFVVHYAGWDIFSPNTKFEIDKLQTLVFNIYVWMQFFNQQNCRRVDNKVDIFYQGAFRNPWFIAVQCITIAGQFAIIFKGGEAFDTTPLTGAQWGWSLLFGILTLPLGALIRQVPDSMVQGLFDTCRAGYHKAMSPFRRCFSKVIPRRWKRRGDDAEQQQQQEMSRIENIIQSIGLRTESTGDVTTTAEQRAALEQGASIIRRQETERPTRHIDLQGLVEAAKLGREYRDATLEIHPRTSKDDPILSTDKEFKIPPSQNRAIMKFITVNTSARRRQLRNNGDPLSRDTQQRPRPPARRRSGFKWESLLRSKRR